MMKLRINPIVAEDLKKMKEYIAEDNEEMAVKTIQEIYARIENIQQFPYMRADLAKRVSFRTDYKYVICGNYVVLYKIGKEYVGVCRSSLIPHTSEKNGAIFFEPAIPYLYCLWQDCGEGHPSCPQRL